jgi:hypothetical protein
MFLGVLESVEEQHPAPLSEFAQPMAIVGYILELHSGPVRVIRPPVIIDSASCSARVRGPCSRSSGRSLMATAIEPSAPYRVQIARRCGCPSNLSSGSLARMTSMVVGCSWTSVMRGYSGSATTPRLCPRSTP